MGPEILVVQIFHPMEAAEDVLRAYRDFMAAAPDEVGCYALIVRVPPVAPFPEPFHGRCALALVGCHSGSVDTGREAFEPLSGIGDPILNAVQPMPYASLQSAFDAGYPDGERYYGKSCYFAELSDDAIASLVQGADPLAGSYTGVFLEGMGGAINRKDPGATAFPHRNGTFNLGITTGWNDADRDEEMIEWTRGLYETMAPHGTGGVYVNYLDHDERDRIPNAYGENYQRLKKLKEKWDPDGILGG
ncbi:MAG: BBE domain-containing protein [Longimicrobiales bacterium]